MIKEITYGIKIGKTVLKKTVKVPDENRPTEWEIEAVVIDSVKDGMGINTLVFSDKKFAKKVAKVLGGKVIKIVNGEGRLR